MHRKINVFLSALGFLLPAFPMAKIQAQNNETAKIYIGLCSNPQLPGDDVFMAFNSALNVATQAAVPGEIFTHLKGCKVTGVRFAFGFDMAEGNTALVKLAKSNHLTGIAFGRKKAVKGWNEISFSAPVATEKLTEEKYYFGYEFFNPDPQCEPILLDPKYSDPDGLWLSLGGSEWFSGIQLSHNTLMAQLAIEGPKEALKSLAFLNNVQLGRTMKATQTLTIPLAVSNPGGEAIKSLEVNIGIGTGGTGQQLVTITPEKPIPAGAPERVIIPVTVQLNESDIVKGGETKISVSLTKVNGKDNALAYEYGTGVIFLSGEPIARAALVEQFSTEQCTGCPTGEAKVAAALEQWKGIAPVWLIHHVGHGTDFLSLKEDNALMRFYIPSAFCPGILLDRNPDNRSLIATSGNRGIASIPTVEGVLSAIGEAAAEPGYATLKIENGKTPAGLFGVKISGRISKETPSGDAKPYITVLVAQSNIKPKMQAGIPAGHDFKHMVAPRFYISDGDGEALEVQADGSYSYSKELALPADVEARYPLVATDCKVVAFVHYQNKAGANGNFVLNSAEVPYSEQPLSVVSPAEAGEYRVYAADGSISVIGGKPYTKISVYNEAGCLVPTTGLTPGNYIVVIDSPARRECRKVILH